MTSPDEGTLPEGWASAPIRDLFEIRYGKGLREDRRKPGSISVYGSNGVVGTHNVGFTNGPTIVIGRKGSIGEVHLCPSACWPIDTTYYVDEFHGIDPRFLVSALRNLDLSELDTSTAIPGLNRDDIYSLLAAVPPLAEQQRLVMQLENCFHIVNSVRDSLSKVRAILKRFRQAVLAAACSGRLTEAWREEQGLSTEAVDRELAEISRERRVVLKKYTTEPAPSNPNFICEPPESWRTVSLDELSVRITSGSRDWKKYYRDDGTGTFIMAQNVRPLLFDRSFRLGVSPPLNDRDRERSRVIEGDILITIVGANTGDVCRVPEQLKEHYICQSVALVRPVRAQLSPFLELFLNSSAQGQAQFNEWIYGEGRPHLSFDQLRQTAVILPPEAERQEIVKRVHTLFGLADLIEKRVRAASLRAERLTQSIPAKAFRGELVPTEAELAQRERREYEPASVLLERIRAERANREKASPAPKRRLRKAMAQVGA